MLPDFEAGTVLLIDKPYGWTSFDVVNWVRWRTKRITGNKKLKVGHAGTLDPLATGLVMVCTGKMTKEIDQIQAGTKVYTGTIFLGATTPSYDMETRVSGRVPVAHLTEEMLLAAAQKLTGDIEQIPPHFSAKKINGQPAYKKAHKGIKVEMRPNAVTVYGFELTRIDLPQVEFRITCSKGTYIRSLAHDFGKELGCGGFLAALRRTESGNFRVSEAYKMGDLKIMLDKPYQ
ncbi:MAG: tRNA pseudouridine(55) synthase TruB [Bacteroidota bacterium]